MTQMLTELSVGIVKIALIKMLKNLVGNVNNMHEEMDDLSRSMIIIQT